jgi:hypothetical protein
MHLQSDAAAYMLPSLQSGKYIYHSFQRHLGQAQETRKKAPVWYTAYAIAIGIIRSLMASISASETNSKNPKPVLLGGVNLKSRTCRYLFGNIPGGLCFVTGSTLI